MEWSLFQVNALGHLIIESISHSANETAKIKVSNTEYKLTTTKKP
jgi:hypothetical protein